MAKTTEAKTTKRTATQKAEVFVQYGEKEVDINAVVAAAKAAFKAEAGRVAVKTCQVYVKPLENAAYYVINSTFTGKVDL